MVVVTDQRKFPVGCRFHPIDEEILNHYLKGRVRGLRDNDWMIPDVDICSCDPWELSGIFNGKPIISWDNQVEEGWFFSRYKAKEVRGSTRVKRLTRSGYWKQTGIGPEVKARYTGTVIGTKNILVFHRGKGKNADKTDWVIHEYHLPGNDLDTHVLCRLKLKRDKKVDNSTMESEYLAEFALYLDQPDHEDSVDEDVLQATINSLRESVHPENQVEFLRQLQPAPGSQNNRLPSDIHQLTNTLGPSVIDMLFENDRTDEDIQLMFGRGEEDEDVGDMRNADHAYADFLNDLMLTEYGQTSNSHYERDIQMNRRAQTTGSVHGFLPNEEKKGVVENKFNGSPFASEKPMPRPVLGYKERGSAGNSTEKTNSKEIEYAREKSNSVAASTGTTSESTKTSTNPPLANLVNVLIGIFLLLTITRQVFNF